MCTYEPAVTDGTKVVRPPVPIKHILPMTMGLLPPAPSGAQFALPPPPPPAVATASPVAAQPTPQPQQPSLASLAPAPVSVTSVTTTGSAAAAAAMEASRALFASLAARTIPAPAIGALAASSSLTNVNADPIGGYLGGAFSAPGPLARPPMPPYASFELFFITDMDS